MERKRSVRSVRRHQKKPWTERAKDHCRTFTAFLFSNVGIIILVVLYILAGAFIFTAIEGADDLKRWAYIGIKRQALVETLWNLSSNHLNGLDWSVYEEEVGNRIWEYQRIIVRAGQVGWTGTGPTGELNEQWTFSGALLYSLTVITTIGYGHLAPHTEYGKIVTIFYAIIGMPLFLLYLSNIGDILAKSFKWIYAKVCLCRICPGVAKRRAIREQKKRRTVDRDFNNEYYIDGSELSSLSTTSSITDSKIGTSIESDGVEDDDVVNTVTVPLTICVLIMFGYIMAGAIIFGRWEDWKILDGCYFCFISLSSIGFGDIVPGDEIMQIMENQNSGVELRFIVCSVYLLLGMALIAMCFNLMQEQVIHKMRSFKRGIRRCFRCDR